MIAAILPLSVSLFCQSAENQRCHYKRHSIRL